MSACTKPSGTALLMSRGSRLLLIFALCFAFMATSMNSAEARRGRGLGIALGVGIVGAIIANEAIRAEEREYRRSQRYYRERERRRYYSEDGYYGERPAKRKKAAKAKPAAAPTQDYAAKQPATQEAETVGTSPTAAAATAAAVAVPAAVAAPTAAAASQENSYLPNADRNSAGSVSANAPVEQVDTLSSREEITAAQEHLKYLGYGITSVTGKMDAATEKAVKEFQQAIGAPVTGKMTYEQLQTLFTRTASHEQKQSSR